jgi:hypothetical protein
LADYVEHGIIKMTIRRSVRTGKKPSATRISATLDQARRTGLLGGAKDTRISGRVSQRLVAAAKRRAGAQSDTDVIEIALATLALEDDFGAKLVRRKGSIPPDLDLEL